MKTGGMKMRTPLKNVRHLGAAHEGTGHFVLIRLTAVANAVLAIFLVWLVCRVAGADYAAAKALLRNPLVGLGLLLLILSGTVHMRLGMQTIIEDYVHGEGSKLVWLALNTFFAILVGVASVFAVLKLSFGA
jgi:succinate dehydrogenase / fumarate reductase, membrane anchor subunit